MTSLRLYSFLIFFLTTVRLLAQSTPPLERLISVDIRGQRIEEALRQISRAGRFEFSYDPTRIDKTTLVTVRQSNVPVRQVLSQVFANTMTFKARGNHIILLRADLPDPAPKNLLLDGYILNEQTGERIAEASIFEKTTLASTVSNPFGYYRIRLPASLPVIRLDVRKQAYIGETVTVRAKFTHSLNVRLTPLPPNIPVEALAIRVSEDTTRPAIPLATVSVESPVVLVDSTPQRSSVSVLERGRMSMMKLFVSAQQAIHDINLNRDTLYRDWQVSFIPFIGTNHRLSGRIINRYSVNVLAGYSYGVRVFEIGGLFNVVRSDVQGIQVAGWGNIVGHRVEGVQIAGLFNINGGDVYGVQGAGLFNIGGRSFTGVELAGLINYTNQAMSGGQVAGLINVAGQTVRGVQVAGLIDYANQEVRGGQVSGLVNIAGGSVTGLQLAGLVNYAHRDVRGWQISSILNRARTVTGGLQLGLFNIADSTGSLPIGLLSHVQKGGYRRIELSANEVNLLNVTYRTGVRRFYNILTAGTSFERIGSPRLSAGYGLGTAFNLSRTTMLNLEGSAHHLFYFRETTTGWNQQIRLSTLLETRLSKRLSLAFGPSANWYFSTDGTTQPLLRPAVMVVEDRTSDFGEIHHWGWIGFQIGLRFGNS